MENIFRAGPVAAFHIAVDSITVRPVSLDGNEGKMFPLYELPRDLSAPRVELGRSVSGFAEQDVLCVANRVEKGIEVGRSIEGMPEALELIDHEIV